MKKVKRTLKAKEVEVAPGFMVKRPIPSGHSMEDHDPFLLLDHFGPKKVDPGTEELVPPHPHYGFQPVSLIFEGKVGHKDTMGNDTTIRSGGAQWLTAGKGLMHSELFGVEPGENPGLHGVQLWVNLPGAKKKVDPEYKAITKEDVTEIKEGKVTLRLFAGEINGQKGPASTYSDVMIAHGIFDGELEVTIPIPADWTLLVYHLVGKTNHGEQFDLVEFEKSGDQLTMKGEEGAQVLILAGEPLNEQVVSYGPFIANDSEEIWEAVQAFQAGKMGDLS